MYRLKNIKTGLYYQPTKSGCNLSKTGKVYHHKTNPLTMGENTSKIRVALKTRNRVFSEIAKYYDDTKYWSRFTSLKSLHDLGEYGGVSLFIPKEDFEIEEI